LTVDVSLYVSAYVYVYFLAVSACIVV